MRTGEIPGTGHLERIVFNAKTEELRRESMLGELRQRIREVRQGPDGLLYLLTDEDDGAHPAHRTCAVTALSASLRSDSHSSFERLLGVLCVD